MTDAIQIELRGQCVHPSRGHTAFPREDLERPLHARFERIARENPRRLAIATAARDWSYAELNGAANRIAHAVIRRLGYRAEPVGLFFEHGADVIAALFGVLKAGHIYAPLDPAEPPLRQRRILEQSSARLVLANKGNLRAAVEACGDSAEVLDIDSLPDDSENPDVRIGPDAPASLYYTSGSTGVPKGVLSTHRTRALNAMRNTKALHISPDDRLSLLYASRFAGAVNCTFGALLNGAALLPFDVQKYSAAELGRWLADRRITILHTVPAVYRQMVANLAADACFPNLRLILLASDSVYPADVAVFRERFPPGCLLANSWGVSESPLFRPFFFGHDSKDAVTGAPSVGPMGEDEEEEDEVLLLDEDGQTVGEDRAGEVVLRSRDLAVGYWRDPAQTAERFKPDPQSPEHRLYATGDLGRRRADGAIVHLGRKDFQVQIGGQRVEVGEIEAALLSRDGVRAAAVTALTTESGDKRLVAYLECSGSAPLESDLRAYLAERLPPQMQPDRIVILPALPLTSAGKVDRLALPPPPQERPALETKLEPPRTELERDLVAMFEETLELSGLGVNDSFLELGGKSLGAMRLLTRIAAAHSLQLTPGRFFASPTAAAIAHAVEAARTEALLDEIEGLSESDAGRFLEDGGDEPAPSA